MSEVSAGVVWEAGDCLRGSCCVRTPGDRNSLHELEELRGVKGSCDPVLKVTKSALIDSLLSFPEP